MCKLRYKLFALLVVMLMLVSCGNHASPPIPPHQPLPDSPTEPTPWVLPEIFEDIESLLRYLPESLPLSDFTVLNIPIIVNGIKTDKYPALATHDGIILVPYRDVVEHVGYSIMYYIQDGELIMQSGDGSFVAQFHLTLGSTSARQSGGLPVEICTPPVLIDGEIYVPVLSLFQPSIFPFTNSHILDDQIIIYQIERFPQSPALGWWGDTFPLTAEEVTSMPIFINDKRFKMPAAILAENLPWIETSFIMVQIEPILHELGFHFEFSEIEETFTFGQAPSSESDLNDFRTFYAVEHVGHVVPIIQDGNLYVSLFCFFRDIMSQHGMNVLVHEGEIRIYARAAN